MSGEWIQIKRISWRGLSTSGLFHSIKLSIILHLQAQSPIILLAFLEWLSELNMIVYDCWQFDSDAEHFKQMNRTQVQNIRVLLLLQFRLWPVFIQHSIEAPNKMILLRLSNLKQWHWYQLHQLCIILLRIIILIKEVY